ncbi:GAF domain-containing protein, partial [Candidatus Sumerlaeota bacterium]|nr:GAF domain-containing protein [Candidatus Sumerlaeota bacterium]
FGHGEPAGMGTDTLAGSDALYLPIRTALETFGVLKLKPIKPFKTLDPERLRIMSTLSSQIAQALEKERLSDQAQSARMQIEAEKMRNVLLSSVSHDLRTPLTVIEGSASSLNDPNQRISEETRAEFIRTIIEESRRMDRLISNLLEMSRLESGNLHPNRDWHVLEEIIGVALNRLESQIEGRPVEIKVEPDLPLVHIDDLLMEQVFINLLENILKYTLPGTPIELFARRRDGEILVEIADRGPGLPPGEETRIFEKFHQAGDQRGRRGVGLGLAICRSLIELHGGRIWASNREGGGAVISFTLPFDSGAPDLAEPEMGEART